MRSNRPGSPSPARGRRPDNLRRHGLRWLSAALALRNATVVGVLALISVSLADHLGLSEFEMGTLPALVAGLLGESRPVARRDAPVDDD